jgi:hypothetical protein
VLARRASRTMVSQNFWILFDDPVNYGVRDAELLVGGWRADAGVRLLGAVLRPRIGGIQG